jgi:hypothetical protein
MARHQFLYFLIVPLVLSIVLAVLVISQQPGLNLPASIPRTYTVPQWLCDTTCQCQAPSMHSALIYENIGTVNVQEKVCAFVRPRSGQEYGSSSSTNCLAACQQQFPRREDEVRGYPLVNSRTNCRQDGICRLLVPSRTPTSSPNLSPDPFKTATPSSSRTP